MAVIDWWNGPLTLVVIFFALCLLLLTWSIACVACRCLPFVWHPFFIVTHTHTHTHTHSHTYTHTLGQSGSPRSGKKNWQLGESRKFTRSSRCGFVAQWLECATRILQDPGFDSRRGCAVFFFVWSGGQFFYLCRSWKRREFEITSSSTCTTLFWHQSGRLTFSLFVGLMSDVSSFWHFLMIDWLICAEATRQLK